MIPIGISRVLYKAQQHMKRDEFTEAAKVLERYLQKHPGKNHGMLAFSLGNALYLSGKTGSALPHFLRSVNLDPCHGPAWINLGQVALEQARFGLAAEALKRGFSLSEDKNPDLLYHAAMAHVMDNRHMEAVPILKKLISGAHGTPEKEWFHALFQSYVELFQPLQAERLLNRMLSLYREDPETWKLFYRFEAIRGNYEMAAVAMTIYSYLAELSREEKILLANLYAAIHVPVVAGDLLEKAVADEASPREYEQLVSIHLAAHKPTKARNALNRALQAEPTARLWSLQGDLLYMEKDFQGAYRAFSQSARLDGQNGRAYLMMGYCAYELGKRPQAVNALLKASAHKEQKRKAEQLLKRLR